MDAPVGGDSASACAAGNFSSTVVCPVESGDSFYIGGGVDVAVQKCSDLDSRIADEVDFSSVVTPSMDHVMSKLELCGTSTGAALLPLPFATTKSPPKANTVQSLPQVVVKARGTSAEPLPHVCVEAKGEETQVNTRKSTPLWSARDVHYDRADVRATSHHIAGLLRAACPPVVERPSSAVLPDVDFRAAAAALLAEIASLDGLPEFLVKESLRLIHRFAK